MHCASLGEFEQGRPVIEKIRSEFPHHEIVITFFSPSGYEIVKNYKGVDHVFYLPVDSAKNAARFVSLVKPSLVLWIKYEYWYYYLNELKKKNIPVILISGVYRVNMPFFKWYGALWKKMLGSFSHFFVQNPASKKMLEKIIPQQLITVSGDTRFDRVISIAEKFTPLDGIKEFCGDASVIVAGSTWDDDEAEWTHFIKTHPEIKFIIAPHEVDKENLKEVKKEFPGSVLYGDWLGGIRKEQEASSEKRVANGNEQYATHNPQSFNCLIIDNIGMLSRLYKYATITYVGGGFRFDGLHNILEAAVYGKPVIFGPEYEKNFEAEDLLECDGAITIENALQLEKILNELLKNNDEISRRGIEARDYIYRKAGATKIILNYIHENRLLIN